MMEIDGQAGNLYGKQKINESFELTSAEFHLKTYYGLKNSNSDKESSKLMFKLNCLLNILFQKCEISSGI